MKELFIISIYVVLLLLVVIIGSQRQLGLLRSFLFGLFLTPIIGFILVMFSPDKLRIKHYKMLNKCPECKDEKTDVFCSNCGKAENWSLISSHSFHMA